MALSDYAELKLLDYLFGGGAGYTAPANLYLALYSAAPNDAGGGTELMGNGYVRTQVVNDFNSWPSASGGAKSNLNPITAAAASGAWLAATHFGIFDSSSGGNLLAWGALSSSATLGNGDTFEIPIGGLVFSLAGAIGETHRHALLDLLLGATPFSRPATLYARAFTADPAVGGAEVVSAGSYAGVAVSNDNTNFPPASAGSKSNGTLIVFPTATAGWGTVTHIGLYTSSSGGTLVASAALTTPRTVASGNTLKIEVGAITISLN